MTRLITVELSWDDHGRPATETFGPWEAREDESHLGEITEWLKQWRELASGPPVRVVMTLIRDPQQWLEEHRAPGS